MSASFVADCMFVFTATSDPGFHVWGWSHASCAHHLLLEEKQKVSTNIYLQNFRGPAEAGYFPQPIFIKYADFTYFRCMITLQYLK